MAAEDCATPNFVGYEKMSESTSAWELPKKFNRRGGAARNQRDLQWVVLEKVHGANFCFITNGDIVLCAKRTGLIKPAVAKQKANVRLRRVSIYGELFGGGYPADDANITQENLVQTEIFYCPHLEFYAFDIAIETEDSQLWEYLDYDVAIALFQECGFFYAQPLFTGSFEEALHFNVDFETTIPAKFRLPPLQYRKNKAEGVVIKPLVNLYVDTPRGKVRAIVKKKADEFSEVIRTNSKAAKTQFHTHHGSGARHASKGKGKHKNNAELETELLAYVTPQRLGNVLSKFGKVKHPFDAVMCSKLAGLLVQDVIDTVEHEGGDLAYRWKALTDKSDVRNFLLRQAEVHVKERLCGGRQ